MLDLESPFFKHRICSFSVYFGGRNISSGCTLRTLNQQTPRKKYTLRGILSFDTGICGKMSAFWRKHTSLLPLPLVSRYKNSETENPLLRHFLLYHWTPIQFADCITTKVLVASTIFLVSRRFHPGFGLVGKPVTRFQCRAGWEWYVSPAIKTPGP